MTITPRLKALTSKAVLVVTQKVSAKLQKIKHAETEAVQTNTRKAAAQGRIILIDAEEKVVRPLCSWLYGQRDPVYNDAEHLYVFLEHVAFVLGSI
jgi:hypothetical protein